MARKLAQISGRPTVEASPDEQHSGQIVDRFNRRSYLSLGMASVLGILGFTSNAAGESDRTPSSVQELTIIGTGEVSNFHFTVDDALESVGSYPAAAQGISGTSAEGVVTDEERQFTFFGEIRHLDIDGSATAVLNGEPVKSE